MFSRFFLPFFFFFFLHSEQRGEEIYAFIRVSRNVLQSEKIEWRRMEFRKVSVFVTRRVCYLH